LTAIKSIGGRSWQRNSSRTTPHKANQQRFLAEASETVANSLGGASGVVVIDAPSAMRSVKPSGWADVLCESASGLILR